MVNPLSSVTPICARVKASWMAYGVSSKWMVYNGKSQSKMDDLEVPLFQETSKFLYSWFDHYPRILAIQSTATVYYIVSVIDDMFHHILSNIQ